MTYFFAFFSLNQQVLGLYGSKGIVPIASLIKRLSRDKLSWRQWLVFPSLFLINSEDYFIKWLCRLGALFSILVIIGLVPAFFFLVLWIFYASFVVAGGPFLRFQWDSLLLEVGAMGIFLSIMTPPPLLLILALYFSLFRLIFASGLVKFLSGCPEWRSLNALKYHFETQPLPNIGGYFAHQIPSNLLRGMTALTFILEILPPIFIFGTASMKMISGLTSLILQVLIIFTGNYAFFNLLTIALISLLFENGYLGWINETSVYFQKFESTEFLTILLNGIGAFFLFLQILSLLKQFLNINRLNKVLDVCRNLEIVGFYGLFAVMTTKRIEVVFEGTLDGVNWKEYEFKFKPQALNQYPLQIAPLQPRLDWQLWFVPLNSQPEYWVHQLIKRLEENSEEVLKLFKTNPFPLHPPRQVRMLYYQYHFTSLNEWKKTGNYWQRRKVYN